MDFIQKDIQAYSEKISQAEPPLLQKLNKDTHLKVLYPRMLSGHWQGRFLSFFSKTLQPKRILEIGTYTGYACLCMAEGLGADGKMITIEVNRELEEMCRDFFAKANMQDKIELIIGNALEIIPRLTDTFDLVFIDADKENYLKYYELVLPKVRTGGVILADNVLWSGKVVEKAKTSDKETISLQNFNDFLSKDTRVECLLFPIRDGILAARKL